MSRGRNSINTGVTDNWKIAFFSSIGYYITLINKGLSKSFESEPLSKHIKIVGGYAFKNVEYKKSGVPIIRISDFNNEKVDLNNVVFYDESPLLAKYELKESDIIIALTGGTIGKLGIVQEGLGKLYLNQRVGKFEVLNPNEFEKEYIYWIARGVEGIVKNLAWGAAIPNVSPKQIEELIFPIPTKNIQKSIIQFLNDLKNETLSSKEYFNLEIEKELISIQNKQVKALEIKDELSSQLTQIELLNQAILQEAVQGKLVKQNPADEPASQLLKHIKAEKAKSGKKEKPLPPIKPEEIPFDIPENWVWCRLGEITVSMTNGIYKQDKFYNENGTGCLRMYNIKDGVINFNKLKRMILTPQELETYSMRKNDILLNRVNSVELLGKAGLVNDLSEPLVFESKNIRIRLGETTTLPLYLNYYMLTPFFKEPILKSFKKVTGQASISQEKLIPILIPLPPLSEQTRIVAEIEKQLALTKQLKEHIIANQHATEQLLKALLHGAFEVEEKEKK